MPRHEPDELNYALANKPTRPTPEHFAYLVEQAKAHPKAQRQRFFIVLLDTADGPLGELRLAMDTKHALPFAKPFAIVLRGDDGEWSTFLVKEGRP